MRTITRVTIGCATAAMLAGCGIPTAPVEHTPPTVEMSRASHDAPAAPRAPGSGDGTWLVPSQIRPGTYRADQITGASGYVEVCADLRCRIGDENGGMIENYTVDGPTYIDVPSNAASVKTKRVTLTLVGAPPSSTVG